MGWIEDVEEWTDWLIEGRMDLDQRQFGDLTDEKAWYSAKSDVPIWVTIGMTSEWFHVGIRGEPFMHREIDRNDRRHKDLWIAVM